MKVAAQPLDGADPGLLPFAGARLAFALAITGAVAMTALRAASFLTQARMLALVAAAVVMVALTLYDPPRDRVQRAAYLGLQLAIAVAITFASRGHGSLVLLPVLAQGALTLSRRAVIAFAVGVVVLSAWSVRGRVASWPAALAGTAGIAAGTLFVTAFMLLLLREHRVLRAFTRQAAQLAAAHERTRIAREVHDILAHTLTAVHAQLSGALAIRDHDPARSIHLVDGARSLTEAALGDLRRSISELHEHAAVPLVDRVRSLLVAIEATGTHGALLVDGHPREEPHVSGAAYRVIQECITNAIRHGAASRIDIELGYSATQLHLVVEDDGRGTVRIVPGLGLRGITDRVTALGGDLAIGPRPGTGVRVEVHFPLA
jgi:signal transduction histidine kinase